MLETVGSHLWGNSRAMLFFETNYTLTTLSWLGGCGRASVRERSSRSIAIGIHQGNEEDPIEAFSVLIEDSGDLDSMLTEAVVRGFNEAIAFAWRSYRLSHRPVGRPFSNRIMMQGQRAAELHSKGLSYGKIAPQLCDRKNDEPRHHCNKSCADRIRQRANFYRKMPPGSKPE
jgi:hypothetical protein